jgi:predicted MFS family arabinose efflux permease
MPLGLELAQVATWRAPLFVIAALGLAAVLVTTSLPPLRAHLTETTAESAVHTIARLLRNTTVLASYAMTFVLQMSGFLLIPSISPYLQLNREFPREALGLFYLGGGLVSAMATKRAGRLVDRHGSLPVAAIGLALLAGVIAAAVWHDQAFVGVPVAIAAYMLFTFALALRNVAYNTLASKVPRPAERARFQSLQSAVTHAAISAGAAVAGHLLSTGPRHQLFGIPRVAHLAIAISILVPVFMWRVERRVRQAG